VNQNRCCLYPLSLKTTLGRRRPASEYETGRHGEGSLFGIELLATFSKRSNRQARYLSAWTFYSREKPRAAAQLTD
jgi:hypothetical protein